MIKKKETKVVAKFNTSLSPESFIAKVEEQYIAKYASDMVRILEDKRALEAALEKVKIVITAVEKGDYSAIEKYKKARQLLEVTENGIL